MVRKHIVKTHQERWLARVTKFAR